MTIQEAKEYFQKDVIANRGSSWAQEAKEIALQALNKANKISPITHEKHYFLCPYCKEELSVNEDDIFVYDMTPPNYCEKCGQALDWSVINAK